jgi:hypothetical protein
MMAARGTSPGVIPLYSSTPPPSERRIYISFCTQKATVEIILRRLPGGNCRYVIPNDRSVGRSIADVIYSPRSRW